MIFQDKLLLLRQFLRTFLAACQPPAKIKIEHLILYPTGRCNLKCAHCFSFEQNTPSNDLSFEEIKEIARVIPRPLWLDIGGGEPFLREDLVEICGLFDAEKITIPTNGWFSERVFQTAKKLSFKKQNKIIIVISFEGFPETHDSIRGQGSFERAIQTFKAIKEIKGIRVGFSTTLTNKNEKEIIPFIKDMNKYGPDFHGFILLRGQPRNNDVCLPALDKLYQIGKDAEPLLRQNKFGGGFRSEIEKNFVSYRRQLAWRTLKEKRQVIPCLGGRRHLVIFSNGDVHPCELLPPVGNIRKESLAKILQGLNLKESIRRIRQGVCHCTHECIMLDNILLNPLSYFNLLWRKKW